MTEDEVFNFKVLESTYIKVLFGVKKSNAV